MDQPYSPFADWLSKFHTSSEPIQALWIVAFVTLVLGLAYFLSSLPCAPPVIPGPRSGTRNP